MSRDIGFTSSVGNEFLANQPHLQAAMAAASVPEAALPQVSFIQAASTSPEAPSLSGITGTPVLHSSKHPKDSEESLFHRYSLAVFALLFLAVSVAAIQVGSHYWWAHIARSIKPAQTLKITTHPIAGLNTAVSNKQLQTKLQTITAQPATLTVGTQAVPISSDTIKSWLQITTNASKTEDYIHVNTAAMSDSLTQLAGKYTKAPVNQVTATHDDGTSAIIVAGVSGTQLSDPNGLKQQAQQAAKTVMNGKGLTFNTPVQTMPFQAVTPAVFNKLIEVNVVTKKMYAYQNGQLVRTFLVSAGAPATPTPRGQFHIFAKYSVQDMRGLNTDGTPYFQPHVYWVNYFSGGNAIHGVYWHPLSWFGAINSSHGCVGVPDDQAQWIYNWAPIGTTVITHA